MQIISLYAERETTKPDEHDGIYQTLLQKTGGPRESSEAFATWDHRVQTPDPDYDTQYALHQNLAVY